VMNTRVLDEERKRLKERKKGLRIIATVWMFNFKNFSDN
jgi:hypothetical protein